MSEYANLSKPDPEIAEALAQLLPQTLADDSDVDVQAIRTGLAGYIAERQKIERSQLPPDSSYQVKDHTVPVDGGSITVRSLVPNPQEGSGDGFPLLLWTHTGGFVVGSIDLDDYFLRRICVEKQISILNVGFRLAPEYTYPTSLNDSYSALKWAAGNPSLFRASLDKGFIVGGASSGSNLATVIAHRARDDPFFEGRRITGQLLQHPLLLHPEAHPDEYKSELLSMEQNKNAPFLTRRQLIQYAEIAKLPKTDPDYAVLLHPDHKGVAPAFLQIAGLDPHRDEGILYEKLLREAGVKTKIELYPGLPNGGYMLLIKAAILDKHQNDWSTGLQWLLDGAK